MSPTPSGARTLRGALTSALGVWEGSYRHLAPDGTTLERLASRQETRLEGDNWFERIIYRRTGAPDEVVDFRARFVGEHEVVFDDANFEGRSRLVSDRHLLFPYRWKQEPDVELVELITFATDDYRTRLWQRFSGGVLDRLTVIEERRISQESPAVWH
ncbi:DUF3598 family protein [Ornithinimicrobium faecis]|uniref:DUF3598 family protein n=1 Tax=Ornithinimicrobium faecis TaxID=2934158 RepID=UPI002117ADE6|nr:DUF3598 family protein [Ornithinimicrobium sp. HY1745]